MVTISRIRTKRYHFGASIRWKILLAFFVIVGLSYTASGDYTYEYTNADGCTSVDTLHLTVKDHKIVDRSYDSKTIPVRADKADAEMRAHFQKDYEAVKAFTLREVGVLNTDLWTRDAFRGMCDYLNLVHTLSIGCKPAEISFAAPLTFNGHVESGIVRYNDLFTIYPFENQLFVVKMTGEEIRNYLEHSYDKWINTIAKPDDTLLKIQAQDDPRTQQIFDKFAFFLEFIECKIIFCV